MSFLQSLCTPTAGVVRASRDALLSPQLSSSVPTPTLLLLQCSCQLLFLVWRVRRQTSSEGVSAEDQEEQ